MSGAARTRRHFSSRNNSLSGLAVARSSTSRPAASSCWRRPEARRASIPRLVAVRYTQPPTFAVNLQRRLAVQSAKRRYWPPLPQMSARRGGALGWRRSGRNGEERRPENQPRPNAPVNSHAGSRSDSGFVQCPRYARLPGSTSLQRRSRSNRDNGGPCPYSRFDKLSFKVRGHSHKRMRGGDSSCPPEKTESGCIWLPLFSPEWTACLLWHRARSWRAPCHIAEGQHSLWVIVAKQ